MYNTNSKTHYSTKEAADALGYSYDYVSKLCRTGYLKAERSGNAWLIATEDLEAFKRVHASNIEEYRLQAARRAKRGKAAPRFLAPVCRAAFAATFAAVLFLGAGAAYGKADIAVPPHQSSQASMAASAYEAGRDVLLATHTVFNELLLHTGEGILAVLNSIFGANVAYAPSDTHSSTTVSTVIESHPVQNYITNLVTNNPVSYVYSGSGVSIEYVQRAIDNVRRDLARQPRSSSAGGTDVSTASIEDLADVGAMTKSVGDLLYWNGSAWSNIATSSLGLGGGVTAVFAGGTGTSTAPAYGQLLMGDGAGGYALVATSSLGINAGAAAAGGASGQVQFNDAGSLNGNAQFTFDQTTQRLVVSYASTTAFSSAYASSTNLFAGTATLGNLSGILKATGGLVSVAAQGVDYESPLSFVYPLVRSVNSISLVFGTTTQNFWSAYNNFGSIFATNASSTNATTTSLGINSETFTDLTGSGLQNIAGALSINATGDWTGTFDGQEGAYYLSRANHTGTQLAATISDFTTTVNAYIHGSTTIPKTYTANTFTAANVFSGGVTIGALNGPLQANAGVVSATSSVGVLYGGTGLASPPAYGQVLVGNSSGGYTLTATSSLGLAAGGITSIGPAGSLQPGSAITLATSSTAFNGLTASTTISASGNTITFANTLAGLLGVPGGGTGSTTLGGILTGNGTGQVTSATVSAPLTFSGNTLAITQATTGATGYLSSTDFNTFNNKISSTSLSGASVISYNNATGVITTTGGTFGAGNYIFPGSVTAPYASSTAFSSAYASTTSFFVGNETVNGRTTYSGAPVYDLASGALASQLILPLDSASQTVGASKTFSGIRFSRTDGSDITFTGGSGSVAAGIYSSVTAGAGSNSGSNVYGAVLHATNAGAGTTRGLHAGGYGATGATGPVNAVAGEIIPVATNSTASAFFASLNSSGVNDIAVGFDLESSGDRYVVGYGNVINPVPIGSAYYRAWMSSASSANARAFQINNNAGNEIAYWNGNGALYTSSTASIGTTTPYARATVWGGASDTTLFEVVNSASTTALSVSASGFGTTTLRGLTVNGSATSTSNVGFNITTGCYAVNGTCLSTGGGVSSVSNADGSLTISPTTGAVVASLNFANANTWTGLQQFNRASTTLLSSYDGLYVGRTATTTIRGDGIASILPYASSTSITTSGTTYLAGGASALVGVGTTTPGGKLVVSTSGGENLYLDNPSGQFTTMRWMNNGAIKASTYWDNTNTKLENNISSTGAFTWVANGTEWARLTSSGNLGLGTTTPQWKLNIAVASAPQLTLSDASATAAPFNFRAINNNLYISTSSPTTFATTSPSIFSLNSATGSTTLLKLDITGAATSSFAGGVNLSSGCFSINGTCVGGSSFSNTLASGGTATTTFYNGGVVYSDGTKLTQAAGSGNSTLAWDNANGRLGIGTTSPWGMLSINPNGITGPAFAIGSTTATTFMVGNNGYLGIGTTSPTHQIELTASGIPNVDAGITASYYGDGATSGNTRLTMRRARGTVGAPTAVAAGDRLYVMNGAGFDGTTFQTGAQIYADVEAGATVSTGIVPTFLAFTTMNSAGALAERLRIAASGNIGIASSSPWGLLSVNPNALGSGVPEFVIGSSTATHLIVTGAGNVGIGTTSPYAKLSVEGPGIVNAVINTTTTGATNASTLVINRGDSANGFAGIAFSTAGVSNWTLNVPSATSDLRLFNHATAAELMRFTTGGNVGIGTTTPGVKLGVFGAGGTGGLSVAGTVAGLATANAFYVDNNSGDTRLISVGADTATKGSFSFVNSGLSATGFTTAMTISSTGNVGIATSSPIDLLSIYGGASAGAINIGIWDSLRNGISLNGNDASSATGYNILSGLGDPNLYLNRPSGSAIKFREANSSTDQLTLLTGGSATLPDGNFSVCTGGACPSGTPAGNGNIIAETAIGVGTSTPWAGLSIVSGKAIVAAENTLATTTSMTVDWRNGNQQLVRLGTSGTTISFSGFIEGQKLVLTVCNPNATAGAISWGTQVLWSSGTAPTQTTTANKCDVWSFLATNATSTLKIFGAQSANF